MITMKMRRIGSVVVHRIFGITTVPDLRDLDKPLVFVHIMKTAGTSFVNYLHSNMPSADIVAPPFMGDLSVIGLENKEYRLYWGHFNYSMLKQRGLDAYYLTFLREPLSRVISQYKSWHKPENLTDAWLASMQPHQIEAVRWTQTATLEEFVLSDNPYIVGHIRDVQTRFLSDNPDSVYMLQSAKSNLLRKFYFFGVAERFDDSISLFRKMFKNARHYSVPEAHENRSIQLGIELSQKALDRIGILNINDQELYEYALGLFENNFRKRG